MQDAFPDFHFVTPDLFVGHHQFGDGQPVLLTLTKQVGTTLEWIGQRRLVFNNPVSTGGFFINHKATAYRIVGALAHQIAVLIKGGKHHAVRMVGQGFLAVIGEIGCLIEGNGMLPEQT